MANEKTGLFGRKLGMTQIYNKDGAVQPVTIIEVSGNTVLRVKTADSKDGYNAIQLGFDEKKESRTNKPDAGNFAKAGVSPKKLVREIRLGSEDLAKFSVGQELSAGDIFTEGELVDVTGTSKGRGFTGVMKRHNFAGFIRSHVPTSTSVMVAPSVPASPPATSSRARRCPASTATSAPSSRTWSW